MSVLEKEMKTVSLRHFLEEHGNALGERIEQELTPVYNLSAPDSILDVYDGKIGTLIREPFPVQREIIKGLSKALYHKRREKLFICGEMGTGKTMLTLSVIAMSSKPMRVLVASPGHLVNKWIREARITIPGVRTVDLAIKNAISILDTFRSEKTPLNNHELWFISREKLKLSCGWEAAYTTTKRGGFPRCPDCGEIPQDEDGVWLTISVLKRRKCKCHCGSVLWQNVPRPRRFAPMEFIKRYLRGKIDMVVLDEVHDYKAGDTLQGHAMGILATCSRYFLGLTGTLNGGYADNLFYLLYRLEPHRLDEFGYHGNENWQRQYGVIEEIRELENDDHSYGRIKRSNVIIKKKPGVSPEVIGKYFLDKSCFIRLADVVDGLPSYDETVITVKMSEAQRDEYSVLEDELREAVKKYKMKASGAMLQSLLSYPDSCVVYPEYIEIKAPDKELGVMQVVQTITAPKIKAGILPKESELLEICNREKDEGRKVLVYITFTGKRDIRDRVKTVLEKAKFKVGILPETVEPKKREEWIERNAYNFDVLLSNPELVKVGLDLIQFPTIVFYQTGYNIFTLRQASRRSWRIGQRRPVRVFFMAYKNTMQETAISLIAKKLEVALLVEGDLPEGLAEYQVEGGSLLEEMSRALIEGRKCSGAETAWANFRKKEIEANLGIGKKETIFTGGETKQITAGDSRTSVIDNTVIKVTVVEGRRKKAATLTVQYGELESVLQGKAAQFALF